jgi:hypothetical protein
MRASRRGYAKIGESLLQDSRVDPSYRMNEAICDASSYGHYEVVRLLLRVDPSDYYNAPIRKASSRTLSRCFFRILALIHLLYVMHLKRGTLIFSN